eukprot:TRINITY_DN3581_c0_g1_i2.p1 TRINITY_DN3581_c0_g1~~TRINITY_DN3581_c0_g1_i2.p1  ORF type:complete len:683 (+),score=75.66 TRINITY_DN3581_c0_g1_i2:412-2460(+)
MEDPKQNTPLDQQVLKILGSYGDSTLNQAETVRSKPGKIFANFQASFLPSDWFIYFKDVISNELGLAFGQLKNVTQVLKAITEPSLIVIECPGDIAEIQAQIRELAANSKHIVLLLGDVEHLISASMTDIWPDLVILDFVATKYDVARQTNDSIDIDRILSISGGIPKVVFELCQTKKPSLDVPWTKFLAASCSLSNAEYQALFSVLFVHGICQQPIPSNWLFRKVSYAKIARACCFLLAPSRSAAVCSDGSTSAASSQEDQHALNTSHQGEQHALSGSQEEPAEPHYIVVPQLLSERYILDNPTLQCLTPDGQQLAGVMMEVVACQNMLTLSTTPEMTFGQRYSFLAESFVKDLKHNINGLRSFPKVTGWSKRYDPGHLFSMATIGRRDWPAIVTHLLNDPLQHNRGMVPAPMSHSPDYMAVIDATHLLCIQLKSGNQNPSFEKLIDELAKCPSMHRTKNCLNFKPPSPLHLTFIYAAMNHKAIAEEIQSRIDLSSMDSSVKKADYYRLDRNCTPEIPENVEVIVLRKTGLYRLLGKEHYDHILQYDNKLDEMAAEVITEFEQIKNSPYAGGQTTSNAVMMMHKLFPEWLSSLKTKEDVQEFLENLLPGIASQCELVVMDEEPAPAVPKSTSFTYFPPHRKQPSVPSASVAGHTRTVSEREDEDKDEQSANKKPKTGALNE